MRRKKKKLDKEMNGEIERREKERGRERDSEIQRERWERKETERK